MHTAELDSAVGCTLQSQNDLKMSVFRVFVLAMSFDFVSSKNVLKGVCHEIFDLHFFSRFEHIWDPDKQAEVFSNSV